MPYNQKHNIITEIQEATLENTAGIAVYCRGIVSHRGSKFYNGATIITHHTRAATAGVSGPGRGQDLG